MKKVVIFALACSLMAGVISCKKESADPNITAGDYPVKEYALERNPNVNVWGAGMDLIHADSGSDTSYLKATSSFPYDLKFYTVMAYYKDNLGNTLSEGCPAVLLGSGVTACKIGAGINFFDSCKLITPTMTAGLKSDVAFSYDTCKTSDGKYDRTKIFAALDKCVIGRSFRSGVLLVPTGKTEKEVQAVYLIKTAEGGYAKFMVKQFQGDAPNQKQTIMRFQIIQK